MKQAVISIGSNAEDRGFRVQQAIEFLMGHFTGVSVSDVYGTEAWNQPGAPGYFNAVFVGRTTADENSVIALLKGYEQEQGRTMTAEANGIVTIDLDLVMWDGRILRGNDFERPYFNVGYRQLLADGAFESFEP